MLIGRISDNNSEFYGEIFNFELIDDKRFPGFYATGDKIFHIRQINFKEFDQKVAKEIEEKTGPISELATEKQVGGNHYKQFKIQPFEFIQKNDLNFGQGNVVKYVCRYKYKNGIEDLKKAKHYLELLAQTEYGEQIWNVF